MMQRALHFLKKHPEVVLATCEGNLPKTRVFQVMKQEETTLYFATSPRKDVYRQLLNNPYLEMLGTADRVSVRCAGQAHFEVSEEVRRWIYENNPVLPRLYERYDQLVYFAMPISEMDYYDLNPTPPILQHFDLMTGETGEGFVGERYSSF